MAGNEVVTSQSTSYSNCVIDLTKSSSEEGMSNKSSDLTEPQRALTTAESIVERLLAVEEEICDLRDSSKQTYYKLNGMLRQRRQLLRADQRKKPRTKKEIKKGFQSEVLNSLLLVSTASPFSSYDSIVTSSENSPETSSVRSSVKWSSNSQNLSHSAASAACASEIPDISVLPFEPRPDISTDKTIANPEESLDKNLLNIFVNESSSLIEEAINVQNISSIITQAYIAGATALIRVSPSNNELGAEDNASTVANEVVHIVSGHQSLSHGSINSDLVNNMNILSDSKLSLTSSVTTQNHNHNDTVTEETIDFSKVINIVPEYFCDITDLLSDVSTYSAELPSDEQSSIDEFCNDDICASIDTQSGLLVARSSHMSQSYTVVQPISVIALSNQKKSLRGKQKCVNVEDGITLEISLVDDRRRKRDRMVPQSYSEQGYTTEAEMGKTLLSHEPINRHTDDITSSGESSISSSVLIRNMSESRSADSRKKSLTSPRYINKSNDRLLASALSKGSTTSASAGLSAVRKAPNIGSRTASDGQPSFKRFKPNVPKVKGKCESSGSMKVVSTEQISDAAVDSCRVVCESDVIQSGTCDNVGKDST